MTENRDKETEAYLARIRRTIEESNRLVEQAGLRIRETDRLLEQQGLTREQVMAMRFSDAQIAHLVGSTEEVVRTVRTVLGVHPLVKTVDTCAGTRPGRTVHPRAVHMSY